MGTISIVDNQDGGSACPFRRNRKAHHTGHAAINTFGLTSMKSFSPSEGYYSMADEGLI